MNVILKGKDITQTFSGLVAVDKMNFELNKGEIVGIIGPNGAGKTTLFNVITGIYAPTSGAVYYRDKCISGLKPHQITKKGLARTFQNIRLFNGLMVLDNVKVGMHSKTRSGIMAAILRMPGQRREEAEVDAKAEELLKKTGLHDYRYHYANSLPYGLQRRLEIARAMAVVPEILLLDEPAAGMNEQETSDLLQFIKELQQMGYTILLIEHDMRLVMNLCNRIYVMNYGKLIAEGSPEDIRANRQVIDAYLGQETG
jgi:branched-chain amino acid transport system ATP-binding protein